MVNKLFGLPSADDDVTRRMLSSCMVYDFGEF